MYRTRAVTSQLRTGDANCNVNLQLLIYVGLVVFGAFIGSLLITSFPQFSALVRGWLLSDQTQLRAHLKLVFFLGTALLCVPLLLLSVYLWWVASKVLRSRQFPPTRYRLLPTNPVIGHSAEIRAWLLKLLAVILTTATALLCVMLWRLLRALNSI